MNKMSLVIDDIIEFLDFLEFKSINRRFELPSVTGSAVALIFRRNSEPGGQLSFSRTKQNIPVWHPPSCVSVPTFGEVSGLFFSMGLTDLLMEESNMDISSCAHSTTFLFRNCDFK